MSRRDPDHRGSNRSPAPRARLPGRGFTMLEAMVVVAIVGVLALMTLKVMDSIKQRNALSTGPKTIMEALEEARNQAMLTGREVVFILVGNNGASDAIACGNKLIPTDDSQCLRWWILEDVVNTQSARFDETALTSFNPTSPSAANDLLIDNGALPGTLYLGQGTGYTAPSVAANSVFANVPLGVCTFCLNVGGVQRGFVRFAPDGTVSLSVPTGPPANYKNGGALLLTSAKPTTQAMVDTRLIAIRLPSGLITDRLGKSIR